MDFPGKACGLNDVVVNFIPAGQGGKNRTGNPRKGGYVESVDERPGDVENDRI